MVRLISWNGLRKVSLSVFFSLLLLVFSISQAFAWTQISNNFDTSKGTDTACGGDSTIPCIFWDQEANNWHSIDVWGYLDPSLQQHNFDFSSTINAAMIHYNAVSAWNPYFHPCYLPNCGLVRYDYQPLLCHHAGDTEEWVGPLERDSQGRWIGFFNARDNQRDGYAVEVHFNTDLMVYNTTMTMVKGDCTSAHPDKADASWAAAHETGHAESLGHSNFTSALMYYQAVGGCYCNTPQSNDISGLQSIYPGYLP